MNNAVKNGTSKLIHNSDVRPGEEQATIIKRTRHSLSILALIVISVVAALIINTSSRQFEYIAHQNQSIQNSVSGGADEIEYEIMALHRNVQLLARINHDLFDQIAKKPENKDLLKKLTGEFKKQLPAVYTVTTVDIHKNLYCTDLASPVSAHCEKEIDALQQNTSDSYIGLHPSANHYHFDVLVTIQNRSGKQISLFVGFLPTRISKILINNQLYQHRLVLLNRQQGELIEITAAGSRGGLNDGGKFLSEKDKQNILFLQNIKGTDWTLVDIPANDFVQKYQYKLWNDTLLQVSLLLLLSFFMYWQLSRSSRLILKQSADLQQQVYITNMQNVRLEQSQVIAKLGYWRYNLIDDSIEFSKNAGNLLGIELADVIHSSDFLRFVEPGDKMKIRYNLASAIVRHKASQIEFTSVLPNGSKHRMLASAELTHNADGRLFYMFGILQDVTEQREVEKATQEALVAKLRAEELNEAKSGFLANMSHEIRTPMNSIIGFAESLLDAEIPPQDWDDTIITIIRNGHHLLQLINDILDLSKAEANKLEVENTRTEILSVLHDVESLIKPQLIAKGLGFEISYDLPVPAVIYSDPLRLKQILINLCSNAIKFSEEGYVNITVRHNPQTKHLFFDVTDTGIGIKDDQIENVFKAFTQADASITRKYGGTGLGLSLSRNLADLLGGSIEVSSKEGLGSTFTLHVATGDVNTKDMILNDNNFPAIQEWHPFVIPAGKCAGEVLLADDIPDNQALLSLYIKKSGANITVVGNGKLALIAAMKKKYDLIFMDMQMPVLDGISAVRLLREKGYTHPIVALTANAMIEDKQACLAAGCDDFVSKPIDRELFYAVLQRYLKPAEEQQQNIDPIVSTVLDSEPELADLIEKYVKNLTGVSATLQALTESGSWDELKKQAHDIKGTSGNYGFPALSELAREMEAQLLNKNHREIKPLLQRFDELFQRIRKGCSENTDSGSA